MTNTIKIRGELESFLRNALEDRLKEISVGQRRVFDFLYPNGVPFGELDDAIDKCDRTIRKNIADPKRMES